MLNTFKDFLFCMYTYVLFSLDLLNMESKKCHFSLRLFNCNKVVNYTLFKKYIFNIFRYKKIVLKTNFLMSGAIDGQTYYITCNINTN